MLLQFELPEYEACLARYGAPDKVHTMLFVLKQPCLQSNKILQIDPNLTEFEQKALAPGAFRWAKCSQLCHHDSCHLHLQHDYLTLTAVQLACRKLSRWTKYLSINRRLLVRCSTSSNRLLASSFR